MKKIKKNRLIFIIVLIIILVIIGEIFKKSEFSENFSNSLIQSETITVLSNETIQISGEDIFAFNDTSVKLINSNSIIWEDSISLNNPYSVFNNGILGVSQKNGNILKIYSKNGLLYTLNSNSNIISFSLNENGYSSIITKNDDYYEINVYNNEGALIFGLKNISYTEGIPISSSISSNNKLLAVSFLKIDDINYNSSISLYNLENTSEDETTNSLFAAFLQENQFSGIVEFIDNSNLLVISEKQVTFLQIINNNFASSYCEIELNNKLKFAKIIDNKSLVLVYGEPTSIENAFDTNTIVFYDITGKKTGQYTSEKDITNISVGYGNCLIQCNRTLEAINNKGKVLWEYQIIQDLNQFSFFENTNKIIVSSNSKVGIIEINKKSNVVSEEIETLEDNTNSENLVEDDISNDENLVEDDISNNENLVDNNSINNDNSLEDEMNNNENLIDENNIEEDTITESTSTEENIVIE